MNQRFKCPRDHHLRQLKIEHSILKMNDEALHRVISFTVMSLRRFKFDQKKKTVEHSTQRLLSRRPVRKSIIKCATWTE